jgi:hypothetical protein
MTDNMKIWSTFELSRHLTGWCLKGTPPSQADMLETVVHRRFLHCQGQRVLDQWISHHHPPLITPSDQSQSSLLLCILNKYNNTAIVQHSFFILPFVTSLPTCHTFSRPDLSGKKSRGKTSYGWWRWGCLRLPNVCLNCMSVLPFLVCIKKPKGFGYIEGYSVCITAYIHVLECWSGIERSTLDGEL